MLTQESRRTAGILLVVLPTVIYGGVSLLGFLLDRNSGYMQNPLRQNLFRTGHAHAGACWCSRSWPCDTWTRRSCPAAGSGWCVRSSRPRRFSFLRRSFSPYFRRAPRNRMPLSISRLWARWRWRSAWSRSASVCCAQDEWLTHLELSSRTKADPQRAPLLCVLGRK
jgi:hypothetical protein